MGIDLGLQFAPAGGVTAQSLGIPAPQCGKGSNAILDQTGAWGCSQPSTGGGSSSFLLIAAAAAAWWYFSGRHRFSLGGRTKRGHQDDE